MDWNSKRRLEKHPSRPKSKFVNKWSVFDCNLHPPGENVDELVELLSSLSTDPPSFLRSPVIEESCRNVHRSEFILRQANLNNGVEFASSQSGHAIKEGKSRREFFSETKSTKSKAVRFACLERYPAAPTHLRHSVDRDSGKWNNGSFQEMKSKYPTPASRAQLQSCKASQKSQSILTRDADLDARLSELPFRQRAHFDRDWSDTHSMDYTDRQCQEEESFSEVASLLESSWTSTSLYQSMFDLDISEQLLMIELGPRSPSSPSDTLESAAGNSLDVSASFNENMLCSFFQYQQREPSCHAGRMDSRAGTSVTSKEGRVPNSLRQSDTAMNGRLSSQLVRPNLARTLNSAWVPMALSQKEFENRSKSQTGSMEGALSVCKVLSDQDVDKDSCSHKALSQHQFSGIKTRAKGRSSECFSGLSPKGLTQNECHLDTQDSYLYSHPVGPRSASRALAVCHMTGSTGAPHFLLQKEAFSMKKERLSEDTSEHMKRETVHLTCQQVYGDGHATFVEKGHRGPHERTDVPHEPSIGCSHLDQRGVFPPSSTVRAFKESARCDNCGNPQDKKQEGVAGGRVLTADRRLWSLPNAPEVWSSGSIVTLEERFLGRCRLQLLSRCLRAWGHRQRCRSAARCQHRRRVLRTGLSALRWAVAVRCMQTDAMVARGRAALLYQCFRRWKACVEQTRFSAVGLGPISDVNAEAFEWRLVQPSDGLVLRTAYCAWRRHVQGLQLLGAAHIHYHLTLLFKYWLEWRTLKLLGETRVQQEVQAQLHQECRLKSRTLTSWSSAWDRARQARAHHRARRSAAVWRRWAVCARGTHERRQRERCTAALHRRALLQFSLRRWSARVVQRRRARDREQGVARMAIQHWQRAVKWKRLERLCCGAEQVLPRRTLEAALRKWSLARASAAAEQSQVEDARRLLARRRLQAAFASWRRRTRARRGAWLLLEKVQKMQRLHCLRAWRVVVQQRWVWAGYRSVRGALALRGCLQHWRRALELRRLRRAFAAHVCEERRQRSQGRRKGLRWQVEPWAESQLVARSPVDLVLHRAFLTWREGAGDLQRARVRHAAREQERAKAALQHWHGLAQRALAVRVHRFCARLAQLDSPTPPGSDGTSPVCLSLGTPIGHLQLAMAVTEPRSSRGEPHPSEADPERTRSTKLSGPAPRSSRDTAKRRPLLACSPLGSRAAREQAEHVGRTKDDRAVRLPDQSGPAHKGSQRLKSVALYAVGRISHGLLATALWQWKALVRAGKEQRAVLDSIREVSRRSVLSWAFRTWRTGTLNHVTADRHQEMALLTYGVTRWRGAACHKREKVLLQAKAGHFRMTNLLTRSLATWQKRGGGTLRPCAPDDAAQLERRAVWLQRTAVKRTLRGSHALWAARLRQNLAARAYRRRAVLARVFVAWETWAWLAQERTALVLEQLRRRRCRDALDRWRIRAGQQQEVRRRGEKRLVLQTREILPRWHCYARDKVGLRQLFCEHMERKRRMVKKSTLLSWAQEAERQRRADISAQRSLKSRYLQLWHSRAVCGARARRALEALQQERTRVVLLRAFLLWREKQRRTERRLLGRVRTAARHWRQRALLSRAETRRATRLTSRAFLRWRDAPARQGERSGRVQGGAGERLQRSHGSSALRAKALELQEQGRRGGPAESFRRWATPYRSSVMSTAFLAQQRCKRVLLVWRRVTTVALTFRREVACFQAGRQKRLTASGFALWHAELQLARCRLTMLDRSLRMQHWRVTTAAMQYWMTATRGSAMQRNLDGARFKRLFGCWKRTTEAIKAANALSVERERRAGQRVLVMWLHWAKGSKARRQMGEVLWHWVQGRRVSSTFYLWVRVTQHHREASQLSCRHLLDRGLQEWRLAVETSRQVLSAAEGQVHTFRLCAAFTTWRKRTLSQQALRSKAQRVRAGRERRLLTDSLRAWYHQVQARECRSLYLSKKYLSCWVRTMLTKRSRKRSEEEDLARARLGRKYLGRLRRRVLARRLERRRTRLLWITWRNQTAASVLFGHVYVSRLQEWAWLTWRKRRIRTRVSAAFAANHGRALLSQAFAVWKGRTLCSTSKRSVVAGL